VASFDGKIETGDPNNKMTQKERTQHEKRIGERRKYGFLHTRREAMHEAKTLENEAKSEKLWP